VLGEQSAPLLDVGHYSFLDCRSIEAAAVGGFSRPPRGGEFVASGLEAHMGPPPLQQQCQKGV
jgi:hypothetical protein